jgi:hypothetical protein
MSFNQNNFRSYALTSSNYPQTYLYNSGADGFTTVAASQYFNALLSQVQTGDKILVQTASPTLGVSFSGTFRNDNTNVYVDWDRTLRFSVVLANISGGSSSTAYFDLPPLGIITEVYGVQWNAVTVASAHITFAIGGTNITGAALTVPTTGAAGSSYTAVPTALNVTTGANSVSVSSDGGSTTSCSLTAGFKIICATSI